MMKSLILSFVIIFLNMTLVHSFVVETKEANLKNENTGISIYKVGVNDVIDIKVLDNEKFNNVATVSSDGSVILPYVGAVFVKDKTLTDIEEEITRKLSEGYLKLPVVSVSLLRSLSKVVFVYGEVGRPGMYPIEEETTTVLRILSISGGINKEGQHGSITLRRRQKKVSEYKEIYLGSKDSIEKTEKGDMLLKPDDILIVERNKTFLIQGEVVRRGRYALEKDMTVVKALVDAGGVTPDGLFGLVKVRRKIEGELSGYKLVVESELKNGIIIEKNVEDTVLRPDDILLIERNQTFLMQGEVVNRGRFTLEKDMTVLRALLVAGGVTDNGRYGKISLRRRMEGKTGEYTNIVEARLINGVIESSSVEDIVLQPDDILIVDRSSTFFIYGEVGRTGQFVLEDGTTVTKALSVAGGINLDGIYGKIKIRRKQVTNPGYSEIEIDLKGPNGDSKSGDMLLLQDDILIVDRNNTYFLYGEVSRPGEFILKKDITVFQAITIAGGFTKWGSTSRVKLLRSQESKSGSEIIKIDIGDVIKGDVNSDIKLQPGDIVVISSGVF